MDRVVCEGSEDKFPRRVAFKVRWMRKLSNSANLPFAGLPDSIEISQEVRTESSVIGDPVCSGADGGLYRSSEHRHR